MSALNGVLCKIVKEANAESAALAEKRTKKKSKGTNLAKEINSTKNKGWSYALCSPVKNQHIFFKKKCLCSPKAPNWVNGKVNVLWEL